MSANFKPSAAELDRARSVFAANDLGSLTSKRPGGPDEGKPTLRVSLPGVQCDVSLWDGEWRDAPRARASEQVVAGWRQPGSKAKP